MSKNSRYESVSLHIGPYAKSILCSSDVDRLVHHIMDKIYERNWGGEGVIMSRCYTYEDQVIYMMVMEEKGKAIDRVLLLTRKDVENSKTEIIKILDEYDAIDQQINKDI